MRFLQDLPSEKQYRFRSLLMLALAAGLFFLFMASGIRERVSAENVSSLKENFWTFALIILAMTGAWAFALPASLFFFITPLLFPPLVATGIICLGSATGTTMGYIASRYIGGPWVEGFRTHRVTKFLQRHSTFASLFAIRIFPSSPHGFINYGAGLVQIPLLKFLVATLCAVGIKAFLYSTAIAGGAGAASLRDALNWKTVSALIALFILSLGGHILYRRWHKKESE